MAEIRDLNLKNVDLSLKNVSFLNLHPSKVVRESRGLELVKALADLGDVQSLSILVLDKETPEKVKEAGTEELEKLGLKLASLYIEGGLYGELHKLTWNKAFPQSVKDAVQKGFEQACLNAVKRCEKACLNAEGGVEAKEEFTQLAKMSFSKWFPEKVRKEAEKAIKPVCLKLIERDAKEGRRDRLEALRTDEKLSQNIREHARCALENLSPDKEMLSKRRKFINKVNLLLGKGKALFKREKGAGSLQKL